MQLETTTPHSLAGQIISAIVLLLTGTGIGAGVINWLANRKRQKAEVVEISAQTVKVHAEARQLDSQTLIRASERIEELLDLNSALRDELTEANRQLDNVQFDLRQMQIDMAQMQTRSELKDHMIEQLQAASKLGVKLSDLPPRTKAGDGPKDS